MAFLKKLFFFIISLLVVLGLVGMLLPNEMVVERTVMINAAPEKIFPYVNNFRKSQEWSPWAKIDPQGTTYKYEGPEQGVGHKVTWSSENKNVGKGVQEIIESEESARVKTALDFYEHGKANAEFKLQPSASGTSVSWAFNSPLGANPVARWMGLIFKPMISSQFEQGLASMKTLIEALPDETPSAASDATTPSTTP
ncbi:MAG: SRPBCC family protein [Hyphomicrobiaceae bacterium]